MFELDNIGDGYHPLADSGQVMHLEIIGGDKSMSLKIKNDDFGWIKERRLACKTEVRRTKRKGIRWDYRGLIDPT